MLSGGPGKMDGLDAAFGSDRGEACGNHAMDGLAGFGVMGVGGIFHALSEFKAFRLRSRCS